VSRFSLEDPYYLIMAMRWPTFIVAVLIAYLSMNLLFAGVFWLVPGSISNARPGAFGDAFFFSVETLATVGYGVMTPATLYGHIVATIEIFVGMFLTALVTGAFFARFARPRARLVFSEVAVVSPYEGRQALMVRVASRRLQALSEVTARISFLRDEPVGETHMRRFSELKLVRHSIPLLMFSWTLIHLIDEESPLYGLNDARLAAEAPTLMVSITGFDEAISSPVNDRKTYRQEDVRFGHVFADILRDLPGGFLELDITRIHETRPLATTSMDAGVQETAVNAS